MEFQKEGFVKLKRISSIPILDTLEDFHIKIRYLIDLVTLLGGFEREKASEFLAIISKSPPARSPVKFKNRTTGGGYEPKKKPNPKSVVFMANNW